MIAAFVDVDRLKPGNLATAAEDNEFICASSIIEMNRAMTRSDAEFNRLRSLSCPHPNARRDHNSVRTSDVVEDNAMRQRSRDLRRFCKIWARPVLQGFPVCFIKSMNINA